MNSTDNQKIAIIGAGQSGLQIGIGLLKNGFDVTIVTNRTGEEIAKGRITSSQFMFNMALENERELGIEFWDAECPLSNTLGMTIPNPEVPGEKMISWTGKMDKKGMSIDQRVKFPRWMQEFEKLGGNLIIKNADVDYIDAISKDFDLVIMAAGKGDIVNMFERDAEKCMYDKPMRALALTYVNGMTPNSGIALT